MSQSLDITKYALELLELSKKFLAEDGTLDPTAFIISNWGEPLLRPIDLEGEERKTDSLQKIIHEAQETGALAIITIFVARSQPFGHEQFEEETYLWGEFQEGDAPRSILMTVSGPAISSWAVSVPFREENGHVSFSSKEEMADGVRSE